MRIYRDFPTAINETRRELKEMSIVVHTRSVQNMDVTDDPDYDAMELQNYQYTVTEPKFDSIPLSNPQWCEAEFAERVSGMAVNPGRAWELRKAYWKQFLTKYGRFDYAYPERMCVNLDKVIRALKKDIGTRRAFLPVLSLSEDESDNFGKRFPCTIGYWLNFRQGKLNMTYLLRSSDFSEHFNNDLYLANRLQCHIAQEVGVKPGMFTHWIGSLHCFHKDIRGVF